MVYDALVLFLRPETNQPPRMSHESLNFSLLNRYEYGCTMIVYRLFLDPAFLPFNSIAIACLLNATRYDIHAWPPCSMLNATNTTESRLWQIQLRKENRNGGTKQKREGEKQYFPASCFEVQSAASENQPWTIAHSKVP